MAVNRNAFKPVQVKRLKDQNDQIDQSIGSNSKFATRLKIVEGRNRYRILPPHPDSRGEFPSFYEQCTVSYLPIYKDLAKEGETKKERVLKKRAVFNARIHGNKPHDIIETYIKMAQENVKKRCKTPEEIEEGMKFIKGFGSGKSFTPGITFATSWKIYALELKDHSKPHDFNSFVFGELDFKATIRNGINAIIDDESASDPMGVDPFTDVDAGIPITIKFDKEKSGSDMYSVSLPRKESAFPLSDDVLAKLLEQSPLDVRFSNSYKRIDAENAYEGLELFDQLHDYGVFELDEWHKYAEEFIEQFPIEEGGEAKEVRSGDEDEEEDDDTSMDTLEMMSRAQLKQYIIEHKLALRVLPSWSEADIVQRIKELDEPTEEVADELPFDRHPVDDVETYPQEKSTRSTRSSRSTRG